MTRGRSVLIAFALAMTVFGVTHFAQYPGSLQAVMAANGGQKILDMQASFSADETYRRLEAFGTAGREAYRQMVFGVDLVFPLALLAFLWLFAKFASERIPVRLRLLRGPLLAAPVLYFAADLIENGIILALLGNWPERLEFWAGSIGWFTRLKRVSLGVALLLPLAAWFASVAAAHRRARVAAR